MPSEEQLLELERVGGLAPKEQDAVNQLRELKQFPAPLGLPAKAGGASQTQPEAAGGQPGPVALPIPQEAQAGGPGGLLKRAAGEAFFQTVERPGADVNRLGYALIGEKGGAF